MKICISESYEEMSQKAADAILEVISKTPACVLGLATGSTPIGMYKCLVDACNAGEVSFKDITTFNLDEYCGLDGEHDQSYRYFMNKNLFDNVDIDKENTHLPDGCADDVDAMCKDYEAAIENAGYVDIQVLGLGHNGHIGFNEPADNFPVITHEVQLQRSTIEANSRLFDSIDDVPTSAVTMGIGTIMKAKKIIVVANGKDKAEIVAKAFEGSVIPQVPASVLQLHPDVTVFLDSEAASKLQLD